MKKTSLAIVASAALLVSLTSCTSPGADYSRICVNQQHERVDAAKCSKDDRPTVVSSPYIWWYLTYGRALPAIGSKATSGKATYPKSASVEEDEHAATKGGTGYTEPEEHAPIEEPVEPHVAPVEPHIVEVPHVAVK